LSMTSFMLRACWHQGHIHKNSFSSQLTNAANKLKCFVIGKPF
jgi:hypothetical protein